MRATGLKMGILRGNPPPPTSQPTGNCDIFPPPPLLVPTNEFSNFVFPMQMSYFRFARIPIFRNHQSSDNIFIDHSCISSRAICNPRFIQTSIFISKLIATFLLKIKTLKNYFKDGANLEKVVAKQT